VRIRDERAFPQALHVNFTIKIEKGKGELRVVSGFRREVAAKCALLGYYAITTTHCVISQ